MASGAAPATAGTGRRNDPQRRDVTIARGLTALACVYYFALLTDGDWNPFGTELCALVFNDMLARLLDGQVTAHAAILGGESYISNGRTVAYWGIFPAVLRLPLLAFGALYELQIARLSCWIAVCGLAGFLVATFSVVHRRAKPSPGRTLLFHTTVASVLFAGAVLTSLASAYIYNEPIFWAVALSCAFNYVVVKHSVSGQPLRQRDLVVLACIAGLALNCRVLEGASLCLACLWIAILTVLHGDAIAGSKAARLAAGVRKIIVPGTILILFGAICGTVNYLRWGSPLTFVDLHRHSQFMSDPDRVAALDRFGDLNLIRLPFSLSYYLLSNPGLDAARPLFGDLHGLYDKIEGPLSSLLLTDAIPLLLAGVGIAQLFRRGVARSAGDGLVIGVFAAELVGITILLAANYLAMRYRMDFVPALSLVAAVGYRTLIARDVLPGLMLKTALVLAVVSMVTSHVVLRQYKEDIVPYREQARMFWESYQCVTGMRDCRR